MRWWDIEELDDCDVFDSVRIERKPQVEDCEAAVFEAICLTASPGPYMIDDRADGEGTVVATLPDGRLVVSIGTTQPADDDVQLEADANARLICEARCMILRLLRDREQAYERQRDLLDRINVLETRLEQLEQLEQQQLPPNRNRLDPRMAFPR